MSKPLVRREDASQPQNAPSRKAAGLSPEITKILRVAMARDAELLTVLNDREPTAELLESLRSASVDDCVMSLAS